MRKLGELKKKKKSGGGGERVKDAYTFCNLKIPIFIITVSKSNFLESLYRTDFLDHDNIISDCCNNSPNSN